LRLLLKDRGRITEPPARSVMSVNRLKQNVFSWWRKESVDCSCFSPVGSLFHARGAETEKARSPIRRRVRGTTKLPRVEARSAHHAGTSATGVSHVFVWDSGLITRSVFSGHQKAVLVVVLLWWIWSRSHQCAVHFTFVKFVTELFNVDDWATFFTSLDR